MSISPRSITKLFGIEVPIIQAPMLGVATAEMVVAVSTAGGLGSLPLTNLSRQAARVLFSGIRARTSKPVNVNFLCHPSPEEDPASEDVWTQRLMPYYAELGLSPAQSLRGILIPEFSAAHCDLLDEIRAEVVSFHFGLPSADLIERVRKTGAKIMSSATTVEEAVWLEQAGCDAIIAQGFEAGGHRGTFLHGKVDAQVGTIALVPQVVDAVKVPVVAAGGIADPRGVAAAFALGASAVQVGTGFLLCKEANVSSLYRQAVRTARPEQTLVTNVFTGRPARVRETRIVRELGPIANDVPAFPLAAAPLAALRAASEPHGCTDFVPMWCGQGACLSPELSAAELTRWLANDARLELLA